jgi:integrase
MKTLEKEIATYVESKRDIWSPTTLRSVASKLHTLADCFSDGPAHCYRQLVRQGYGRYTIKTYFIIAGQFEKECRGTNKFCAFLQKQKSAFKNCYREKTRAIKPEDYERFLRTYADNPAMYNLLVLMGQAGLRVSEALSAKWSDIEDGFLHVIGKGSKQRVIPFNAKQLKKDRVNTGKIVGTCAFRYFFERDLKPFTPHDFRAFFLTQVANHPELSIKDAAMLAGHSSITTTSRYVRSDINRVAKVLKGGL